LSIIGIAGSSGSGKTSVAMEIVKSLNLPWVVILVMVTIFFLSAKQNRLIQYPSELVPLILRV
jgi:uridine kinase